MSAHHSKAIDDMDQDFLDNLDLAVILCTEEVCPVLPDKAKHLHWPHPDPAAAQGPHGEQMNAFRQARESINRKIEKLKTFIPA